MTDSVTVLIQRMLILEVSATIVTFTAMNVARVLGTCLRVRENSVAFLTG